MPVNTRDAIRTRILTEKPKTKIIELDDGLQIEVRQGKVRDLLDVVNLEDPKRRVATMLITCCYVPGTDERIFEDTDFDALMDLPNGGVFTKLTEGVTSWLDVGKQIEEAGKA